MTRKIKMIIVFACGALALVFIVLALAVPPPSERVFVSRSGYAVHYPGSWIVRSPVRDSSFESEVIREPNSRATISISVHKEPRLMERSGRVAVGSEIELGFERNSEYALDFFGWTKPDIGAADNGYVATGSFTQDDIDYDFKEIGILDSEGSKTTIRSEVVSKFAPELEPIVDASLLSIEDLDAARRTYKALTAEEALQRVRSLPSVILYSVEGVREGHDFTIEVEDAGKVWSVRMVALVKNSAGGTRKVPFQRWIVDKTTGLISRTAL